MKLNILLVSGLWSELGYMELIEEYGVCAGLCGGYDGTGQKWFLPLWSLWFCVLFTALWFLIFIICWKIFFFSATILLYFPSSFFRDKSSTSEPQASIGAPGPLKRFLHWPLIRALSAPKEILTCSGNPGFLECRQTAIDPWPADCVPLLAPVTGALTPLALGKCTMASQGLCYASNVEKAK